MKKVLLLILSGVLSLVISDAAPPPVIEAAQTGVLVSTDHSMAQCTRIAHQTCDQVFGKCAKYDGTAISSGAGYLIMFDCHSIKMTIGGVTALVIAGSKTAGISDAKFSELMTQSYKLAEDRFK